MALPLSRPWGRLGLAITLVAWCVLSAAVQAGEPRPALVPPGLEIEILDPNADPDGNPAVELVDVDGRTIVDIPPVVLVHRYYYTGERSFQGPLLRGGPTIIVVNHPKNGERLYVQTSMPPGAPRVIYKRSSIEYDFGTQGVLLWFDLCGKAKVTYRQGPKVSTVARKTARGASRVVTDLAVRTGLPKYAVGLGGLTWNLTQTTADRVGGITKRVVEPVVGGVRSTPFPSLIFSTAEDRAASKRDQLIDLSKPFQSRAEAAIGTLR